MADQALPLDHVRFRLSSRNPAEVELSYRIAEDMERGVNISGLIKALLMTYYSGAGRAVLGLDRASIPASPTQLEDGQEDPADELVRRMAGISFDDI